MRKLIFTLILLVMCCVVTHAQSGTYGGGGVVIVYSTAKDDSPARRHDGGYTFAGGYAEGGYDLRHNLQARVLAELLSDGLLTNIFTTDEAPQGKKEVRVRPALYYWLKKDGTFRPFAGAGGDIYKQLFDEGGKSAYAYGRTQPQAGLNPFVVIGLGIGDNVEVGGARLFADKTIFNRSELEGYRFHGSYLKRVAGKLYIKVGGEIAVVNYHEGTAGYTDPYSERDVNGIVRVGFVVF